MTSKQDKPIWTPSASYQADTNLTHYLQWLKETKQLDFTDYHSLWRWSVQELSDFWSSLWEYFNIISEGAYDHVLQGDHMPHYKWFQGTYLNYAEHIFRNENEKYPAIIHKTEGQEIKPISWSALKQEVGAVQHFLKSIGVESGDRVVGYLTNTPEATIAFLASNALGAVWSSCSPDFGVSSVIDRFSQIEPKVLFAVNGYQYGGKRFDKNEVVKQIIAALPSLEKVVIIETGSANEIEQALTWNKIVKDPKNEGAPTFTKVPFSHPIWVLYSSGTTGIPKAITHSHGGILMEHLKYLTFHNNIKPGDRCFWYTTTGWMMWNYLQSALLVGGTVVLYDGSPVWPRLGTLWQLAADAKINHLGTSAGYIIANMKRDLEPSKHYDLSNMISLGSTGSPLPPEGFEWIYSKLKPEVWVTSISGGTDVCSAFVGGHPLWPVYMGEIQCRALGCSLEAFDENSRRLEEEVGEMVITQPMPSMPIFFWNDKDDAKYLASYFEKYEGLWRHGDWIKITKNQGLVIYGRSDATLNRGGVRIGTSEIYRAVDKIDEVADSLVVCVEREGGEYFMPLFVKMQADKVLDEAMIKNIQQTIRREYTPRHVPDVVISVKDIPYTISGKKTEMPVKKILMGQDIDESMNKDALKNPESISFFIELAKSLY